MPIHLPDLSPRGPDSFLTRRSFLAGAALGGAALSIGLADSSWSGSRGSPQGWFAWLSDTHIAAAPTMEAHGQRMADNLREAIRDILNANDPPRAVLINGDLAYLTGQRGDYETALSLLEPLRREGIPIHVGMGNHDERTHFRAVIAAEVAPGHIVADKQISVIEAADLRLIMLDSLTQTDVTSGAVGSEQLAWLASLLDQRPATPTIIFVHHHLFPQARSGLLDADALMAVVQPRSQVKSVVYGHTHVWNHRIESGINCVNLPSVAYRFAPAQPVGWCVFRPRETGAEIELRCVTKKKRELHGSRLNLSWRTA